MLLFPFSHSQNGRKLSGISNIHELHSKHMSISAVNFLHKLELTEYISKIFDKIPQYVNIPLSLTYVQFELQTKLEKFNS